MPRDDSDLSAAVTAIASAIALDLLRTVEALANTLLTYTRARRAEKARASVEALNEIRTHLGDAIDRLGPLVFAVDLAEALEIVEALDDDDDGPKPPRWTRH